MRARALPYGRITDLAAEANVSRSVIARVAHGLVRNWTEESERSRAVLVSHGLCPEGHLPESRRDRWWVR